VTKIDNLIKRPIGGILLTVGGVVMVAGLLLSFLGFAGFIGGMHGDR
jgi:hypothetical protein